ncbi:MAG TPA: SdpI family protein [Candidatus Cloacimonadota bacterium]|nr:SdpI family protein [Candidatus Cloacimonadota bacterium]HPS38763.1 SdpI family protein [Candidatus Cloacimonadota bacterium]
MQRLLKYKWSLIVIVIQFIVTMFFVAQIPAGTKIPSHWNIQNEIDGWMSLNGALAFGLGLGIGMFLLMFLMPWYSPWYKKYEERFERVLPGLTFILVLFFALLNIYSLYLAWAGIKTAAFRIVFVMIGGLFIMLGNILPKIPKNFFIGIKTPWTLASDDIWQKTHRLGGLLFVISGLVMIVKGFIASGQREIHNLLAVIAFGMLLYPLVYSFILFRKQDK